ncbi:hypothetical protein [Streptomyces sp. NPDC017940]|uniref:hypothetical protein n=1 Tax=Streptomyces sp. NPDC017940 TaxID=3365017 RepID=UPI003794A3C2
MTGPLIDPHVIDRALGRRAGPRTLEETCARYRVRHQADRGPGEDALSAARLAWRPAWVHPAAVGRLTRRNDIASRSTGPSSGPQV